MIRGILIGEKGQRIFGNAARCLIARRSIAVSHSAWAKKMPDRPAFVNEDEFTESFLKGSGPGGQKIVSGYLFSKVIYIAHRLKKKVKDTS